MIKTLNNIFKQDKEKFVVPKGVQDCIPVMVIQNGRVSFCDMDGKQNPYREGET